MTVDTSPQDLNTIDAPVNRTFAPDLRVCFKPIKGVQNGGCFLDVFAPTSSVTGPVPLMLYVHGGGFTIGASVSVPFRQIRWLRERGIAVASVEYRMLPHVNLYEIQEDALDAYRFVQSGLNPALADAGLGFSVDGMRVGAWGASAGGTFVLLLAADILETANTAQPLPPLRVLVPNYPGVIFADEPGSPTNADVAAMRQSNKQFDDAWEVLLSGPCATGSTRPFNGPTPPSYVGKDDDFVRETFDARPIGEPVPEELRAARLVFIETMLGNGLYTPLLLGGAPPYSPHSPLSRINPSFPPTYVIVAGEDALFPASVMESLYARLVEFGVEARIGTCPGMKHGHVEALPHQGPWPEGNTWWEDVVEPSLEFVVKHL